MAIDFAERHGVDIACVDDIDANLTLVDGRDNVVRAIARRLITPRNGLWYDLAYGSDTRVLINRPFSATQVARTIQAECMKDERIDDVIAEVTFDEASGEVTSVVKLVDEDGLFELTQTVAPDGLITIEYLKEKL